MRRARGVEEYRLESLRYYSGGLRFILEVGDAALFDDGDAPEFYRRRLPHWQPDDAVIFVTFRLAGSLPKEVVERLREERKRLSLEPRRKGEASRDRAARIGKTVFGMMDRALAEQLGRDSDCEEETPRWLGDRRAARIVRSALEYWDEARYRLHRYVIMPNHLHVLMEPLPVEDVGTRWPLRKITQGLKGYTARECNSVLGRRGAFWQRESFDHWARNALEYERIVEYIDMNPVAAGLCGRPEEWEWGSASDERRPKNSGSQ